MACHMTLTLLDNKILDGKMLPVIIKNKCIELSPNNIHELIDGLRNAGYMHYKNLQ